MRLPILLFDPDPIAARALMTQLQHAGVETQITVDGATAVLTARGQRFASIVVVADLADAQMRMCLHELRDADPDAWLIVISQVPIERGHEVVRKLGGNAMIAMPFAISDLAQRLSALSMDASTAVERTS